MFSISYNKEVEAGGFSIDFNLLNGMLHSTSKNKDYRFSIYAIAPVCSIHNAPPAPAHLHSSFFARWVSPAPPVLSSASFRRLLPPTRPEFSVFMSPSCHPPAQHSLSTFARLWPPHPPLRKPKSFLCRSSGALSACAY